MADPEQSPSLASLAMPAPEPSSEPDGAAQFAAQLDSRWRAGRDMQTLFAEAWRLHFAMSETQARAEASKRRHHDMLRLLQQQAAANEQ